MKYLPFLSGKYSTAPGLTAIEKTTDPLEKFIFQIDDSYTQYIENKKDCRKENIYKYYCKHDLYPETISCVNKYIVDELLLEYPLHFTFTQNSNSYSLFNKLKNETITWEDDWETLTNNAYISLFDALCCQVQEDIAVVQQKEQTDWLAAIHLCAPNHWSPVEKSGKTFATIHARFQEWIKQYISIQKCYLPLFKKDRLPGLPGGLLLMSVSIIILSPLRAFLLHTGMAGYTIKANFISVQKDKILLDLRSRMRFSLPYALTFTMLIRLR